MEYKVVEHNVTASKQVMENMLSELENSGWYLKEILYIGGGKAISVHTNIAPRAFEHAKLES